MLSLEAANELIWEKFKELPVVLGRLVMAGEQTLIMLWDKTICCQERILGGLNEEEE